MRVVDVMTTEVMTVPPGATLKEAARLMVSGRVSGLPVVDDAGKLVGIITEADFLVRELEREHPRRHGLLDALFGGSHSLADAETVAEAMTEGVVTITPDVTLAEAARVMATRDVKRLPVVEDDGRLVGVVSRGDVVEAFTRPDDVIEDEIREDVIRRVLFIDPANVDLTVEDGRVTIEGQLPTRTEVRLLEELVRRLDGVVAVENSASWKLDDTHLDKKVGPKFPQT